MSAQLSPELLNRIPWHARKRLVEEFAAWQRENAAMRADVRAHRIYRARNRRATANDPMLVRAQAEALLAELPVEPDELVAARRRVLYFDYVKAGGRS